MKKIILILFTLLMCYNTIAQENSSHELGIAKYVSSTNLQFKADTTLNEPFFHKQFGKKIQIEDLGEMFLTERDAKILFEYYNMRKDTLTFKSYIWFKAAGNEMAFGDLQNSKKHFLIGGGIASAGVLLYFSTHVFYEIPKFIKDNHIGVFDEANRHYSQNIEQRELRKKLRWMRGGSFVLGLIGAYEITNGFKWMKNAKLNIGPDYLQLKYNLNK